MHDAEAYLLEICAFHRISVSAFLTKEPRLQWGIAPPCKFRSLVSAMTSLLDDSILCCLDSSGNTHSSAEWRCLSGEDRWIGLTDKGCHIWQEHSQFDWTSYSCYEGLRPVRGGEDRWLIIGASSEACSAELASFYLDFSRELSTTCSLKRARIRCGVLPVWPATYWKTIYGAAYLTLCFPECQV